MNVITHKYICKAYHLNFYLFQFSDLDWSWFEAEYLVSSSVDTYIYIWDTR